MLLGKRGKNEIRVRDRKETELRLRALRHAFTPHPPGPHRNPGLDQLIPGPFRIAIRIQKTQNPVPLVVFHEVKPRAERLQPPINRDSRPILPTQSRQKHPDPQDR